MIFSYIGDTLRVLLFFSVRVLVVTQLCATVLDVPMLLLLSFRALAGCLLGCLQEPPCTWLCSLDRSCLLFADGNVNAACTGSHCSLSTCLPSPRTEVHTLFCSSEILCLWFTTLHTHDHESLQAYKLCKCLRKGAFQFSL